MVKRRRNEDFFYPLKERIQRVENWFSNYCNVHKTTIEKLAEKSGANVDSLYRWEKGEVKIPHITTLLKLAIYTETDLRSLIGLTVRHPAVFTDAGDYFQLSDKQRILHEEISKLDDTQSELLHVMVAFLRSKNVNK